MQKCEVLSERRSHSSPMVGVATRTQRSSSTPLRLSKTEISTAFAPTIPVFFFKENKKKVTEKPLFIAFSELALLFTSWPLRSNIIISELRFQHVGVTRNTKLDLALKLLYDENPGKPVTPSLNRVKAKRRRRISAPSTWMRPRE